jgi:L-fuculose-phosphate aldolase
MPNNSAVEIVEIGRRLYAKKLIAGGDGNISIRLGDQVLITPTATHKGFLCQEGMATLSIDGTVLSGSPSSEASMHLAVYRAVPEAQAVVHAHPPAATAWSIARPHLSALPIESLTEALVALGKVPFVDYARPGTPAMGDVLLPHIPGSKVLILRHHGSLCWGTSLNEAFCLTEHLESTAITLFHAETLGGLHPVPDQELLNARV